MVSWNDFKGKLNDLKDAVLGQDSGNVGVNTEDLRPDGEVHDVSGTVRSNGKRLGGGGIGGSGCG